MNFQTKERVESKTCPGVFFVLYKITRAWRWELDLVLAEPRMKCSDLLADNRRIVAEIQQMQGDLETHPERVDARKLADLDRELSQNDQAFADMQGRTVSPAWIDAGLAALEGLDIEGTPATKEDICAGRGPEELYLEILAEIQGRAGLNPDKLKNSGSPTISAPEVAQVNLSTIAPSAASISSGEPAIAGATPAA